MAEQEQDQEQTYKLIRGILPVARGNKALAFLREEFQILSAYVSRARGVVRAGQSRMGTLGAAREQDLLFAVVPAERHHEIFIALTEVLEMNTRHAGLLWVQNLGRVAPMVAPEIPASEENQKKQ